ncbi:MAG: cytochrome c-type biogenesis protein CcmH [Thauera sp.]|uniref:cytochrome c-type biogenesis protein n=1 Tax=Thauera sp. JM12B12 TaxID=3142262 RepID=UPI0029C2C370|nr:cytochrome c-type biogenesis protein CcmH [Thauera sp.]
MPAWAETTTPATDPALAPALAADPALEADVMELSHKLRCLVCQNQSIAESNAPLALDLRNQVREQLAAGKDKDDVVDYLVERYGDFVLYEPPFKAVTVLLWLGPMALLFGGAGWLAFRLRRRRDEVAAEGALSAAERARARELLAGGGTGTSHPESPESRS